MDIPPRIEACNCRYLVESFIGGRQFGKDKMAERRQHDRVDTDAGHDLGDSIYEADIFVAGEVASLGADCEEKDVSQTDIDRVAGLLARAQIAADARRFRRYGSARHLYNFHIDHAAEY